LIKQSSLVTENLDSQAFSLSAVDVDGLQFAALDLMQHRLAHHSEYGGGVVEAHPAVGTVGTTRSRTDWSIRIRHGAPAVSCSPAMNPSRSALGVLDLEALGFEGVRRTELSAV
jgi:hypothetical protein